MTLDDLFVAAQTGNREAREALARAVYRTLRTFFRRRCRLTEAEDLVQKTMVVIYRGIDDFVPAHPHAFEAMVIATAHRVLITVQRSWAREQRRRVDSPPLVLPHETSMSERLARREQAAWILAALEQLDSPDRRALLGWALGADWRRLMEAEGVARSTLRTRVHRALARLRDLLVRPAGEVRPDPEPSTT